MKQLIILSGKGGTGKTSVAAAFAHLAAEGESQMRAVLADADVDAANLELVLARSRLESHEFIGGSVAVIDSTLCQGCGTCYDVCRFDAILPPAYGREAYAVDPIACEGCAVVRLPVPGRGHPHGRRNWPATGSGRTAAMVRCSTPRCGQRRRTPANW